MTTRGDAIFVPDMGGPRRAGWLDPVGTPYILALTNAAIFPMTAIPPASGMSIGSAPQGMARRDLHLVVAADAGLYPDSFGKSHFIPSGVEIGDTAWRADLPKVDDTLPGTHLFLEMAYAHFGHAIVDGLSRLWPLNEGLIDGGAIDGGVALGHLGAGATGKSLPGFAKTMIDAAGFDPGRLRFAARPVRVERLLIARRLAPYMGLMHPAFSRMTHEAGARLARGSRIGGSRIGGSRIGGSQAGSDAPKRVFLSRSRLRSDPRGGADTAAIDAVFRAQGFTIVHPQELPLADQVALVRGATHIAGPVGSQMHLCAFSQMPGVRIFTVAPSYFKLMINAKLVAAQGGDETHFLLDLPPPKGPRDKAPWRFDPARTEDLSRAVAAWLEA